MLLSSALIGLREGLEAALVVSILIAFLVKTDKRSSLAWVWLGVAAALVLSAGAGTVITYTSHQLTFAQQEIFGRATTLTIFLWPRGKPTPAATRHTPIPAIVKENV